MKNYTVTIRERAGDYEAQISVGEGADVRVWTGEGNTPLAALQTMIFQVERYITEYRNVKIGDLKDSAKISLMAGRLLTEKK